MAKSAVQHLSSFEDEGALSLYNSPTRMSSPRGSFEFLPITSSNLCFAEDIFLRGQLLPFAPKEHSKEDLKPQEQKKRLFLYDPRRKSLDGRLLKSKSYGGEDSPAKKKPKWYVLAFGSTSLQPDMELGDMRNRRKKLGEQNNGKSLSSGVTWRLIRSLSCRGDAGGVVEDGFVA